MAFQDLGDRFTTIPILTHRDLARQFIVEVDASEVGVGVVLSQQDARSETLPVHIFQSAVISCRGELQHGQPRAASGCAPSAGV